MHTHSRQQLDFTILFSQGSHKATHTADSNWISPSCSLRADTKPHTQQTATGFHHPVLSGQTQNHTHSRQQLDFTILSFAQGCHKTTHTADNNWISPSCYSLRAVTKPHTQSALKTYKRNNEVHSAGTRIIDVAKCISQHQRLLFSIIIIRPTQ